MIDDFLDCPFVLLTFFWWSGIGQRFAGQGDGDQGSGCPAPPLERIFNLARDGSEIGLSDEARLVDNVYMNRRKVANTQQKDRRNCR